MIKMKQIIPIIIGFLVGISFGIICLIIWGFAFTEPFHATIRGIFYRNQDQMAAFFFDPIVTVLFFGILGTAIGVLLDFTRKYKDKQKPNGQG